MTFLVERLPPQRRALSPPDGLPARHRHRQRALGAPRPHVRRLHPDRPQPRPPTGTVQTRPAVSISSHVASRTSAASTSPESMVDAFDQPSAPVTPSLTAPANVWGHRCGREFCARRSALAITETSSSTVSRMRPTCAGAVRVRSLPPTAASMTAWRSGFTTTTNCTSTNAAHPREGREVMMTSIRKRAEESGRETMPSRRKARSASASRSCAVNSQCIALLVITALTATPSSRSAASVNPGS